MASNSLVIPSFKRISSFKGTIKRLLLDLLCFLRESDICAKGRHAWEESSLLTNSVVPRLITVQNQAIPLGILSTAHFLLTLVGINSVAKLVQISKWLILDTCSKSRCRLRNGALRWTLLDVRELRSPDFFI